MEFRASVRPGPQHHVPQTWTPDQESPWLLRGRWWLLQPPALLWGLVTEPEHVEILSVRSGGPPGSAEAWSGVFPGGRASRDQEGLVTAISLKRTSNDRPVGRGPRAVVTRLQNTTSVCGKPSHGFLIIDYFKNCLFILFVHLVCSSCLLLPHCETQWEPP